MPKTQKATIGIRPLRKIFRVSSLHGQIADTILAAQGTKPLLDDHFLEVGRANADRTLRMTNEDRGYYLTLDTENVVYTHDLYGKGSFDFDQFLSEFSCLWGIVNEVMKIREIRRIGYVVEYRFPLSNPSDTLLKKLTNLSEQGYKDKFQLRFETRMPIGKGGLPDPTKDDFINIIREYYDSSIDGDHATDGAFNANIDVQRYFAPALTGNIPDKIRELKHAHDKATTSFIDQLKKSGLTNEQE